MKVLTGNESAEVPVTVAEETIQWRRQVDLRAGKDGDRQHATASSDRAAGGRPVPGQGEGFSVLHGDITLAIDASGP